MPISSVTTNTFLIDTLSFVRDILRDNITDPISSTRPTGHSFVTTTYPQSPATYPVITVKHLSMGSGPQLGMQSEQYFIDMQIEVRIWARNVIEKDRLTQLVINQFRTQQYGSGSFTAGNLHDWRLLSAVDVDFDEGQHKIHTRVLTLKFNFVLGS